MSIPVNHHYVSQCHQKEFFNLSTGLIYLYDKELENHYSRTSSKHLFSEDNSNTKEENGIIDRTTLEMELKILFEDEYSKHVRTIEEFVISQHDKDTTYQSLCWLTLLGIIGEMRHPKFKSEIDNTVWKMQSDIIGKYYDFSKEEILQVLEKKQKTPYSNRLSYLDAAFKILEKLEPLDFLIVSIESNDNFILPDTSCFQRRGQLRQYPNPYISEIIQVGVPLTDKLYILASPQSLKSEMSGIKFERNDHSKLVYGIKTFICFQERQLHVLMKHT
jgi:hypothetical protein